MNLYEFKEALQSLSYIKALYKLHLFLGQWGQVVSVWGYFPCYSPSKEQDDGYVVKSIKSICYHSAR